MDSVLPTKGDAGTVPVTSEPVQPNVTAVDVSVPPPPVAVNVESPVLCHVTAPAADDRTANKDNNAAARTARRANLVMTSSSSLGTVGRFVA
jgi:hypothetical protein